MNALYQGNATARQSFEAIVPIGSLQTKLTAVYDFVIHPAEQSQAGLDYFLSLSDFYTLRAAELGIFGTDGAALVGMASLLKIASDNDMIGIGDSINDLLDAVASGTSRLSEDDPGLISAEFADGTQFDGDDGFFALAQSAADDGFDYFGDTQMSAPADSDVLALIGVTEADSLMG